MRLIIKQSPEILTEHVDAVDHVESQAIEDRCFVDEILTQVKSDVIAERNSWYAVR